MSTGKLAGNRSGICWSSRLPSPTSVLQEEADLAAGMGSSSTDHHEQQIRGSVDLLVLNGNRKAISKRRPRASRRVPTTVLEASCTDFRDMVQRLTGVAVAPAPSPSLDQKLAGADNILQLGAHCLVRPQPKRAINVETISTPSETSHETLCNPSGSYPAQNLHEFYANNSQQQLAQLPEKSQAPQVAKNLTNYAARQISCNLGDTPRTTTAATGNFFGYNNGTDFMATLYGALGRSSNDNN